MNKSDEVEYCNLDLRFNRRHIRQIITELIQDGYSLYWSESDSKFILSVRPVRTERINLESLLLLILE